MSDFDLAFKFTMGEEGVKFDAQGNVLSSGLNNTSGDPGGMTNFGFAQRYNTDIDVTQLTWTTAKQRAFTNYWQPAGCDTFPWPLNIIIFDTCFNQSLAEAKQLRFGRANWEDMLWARLAQYAAKHPANPEFTRWWLVRVLHLRSFIMENTHV